MAAIRSLRLTAAATAIASFGIRRWTTRVRAETSVWTPHFPNEGELELYDKKNLAVVVDCGSGYTRVHAMHLTHEGLVKTERIGVLPAIVAAMDGRMSQMDTSRYKDKHVAADLWIQTLVDGISHLGDDVPVFLGATGGLRVAMESSKLSETDVEVFAYELERMLGDRAKFKVLSGHEEAYAELVATRFIALHKLELDSSELPVNFLSCGGMTSQIGFGSPPKFVSFRTNVKGGNNRLLKLSKNRDQVINALSSYESEIRDEVRSKTAGITDFSGTFIGIEMLGYLAESSGMGHGMMTTKQARGSLEKFRSDWLLANCGGGDTGQNFSKWTWKQVLPPVLATATLQLLSPLPDDSKIMFKRNFEFGTGHHLTPSWPLGVYLEAVGVGEGGEL